MRIKNLRIVILILFFLGNCKIWTKSEKLDNEPVKIPEYVLYAHYIARGEDACITIIDMEKDSIVGRHKISTGSEYITDFCLGPDGMLYFTVSDKNWTELGTTVKIFDPHTGEVQGKIKVDARPCVIWRVPNNEAFVFHYRRALSDSLFFNTVIDLVTHKVRKIIKANLGGIPSSELFFSPDDSVWIIASKELFPLYKQSRMFKFLPGEDVLSDTVMLDCDAVNGDSVWVMDIDFVTKNKLYATVAPIDTTYATYGILILEYPSGKQLKFIPENGVGGILVLPDNKVYIAQCVSWVIGPGENYIIVIDGMSDEMLKKIAIPRTPGPVMEYSPSLNKVYVPLYGGYIGVINSETDELVKIIRDESFSDTLSTYVRIIANK